MGRGVRKGEEEVRWPLCGLGGVVVVVLNSAHDSSCNIRRCIKLVQSKCRHNQYLQHHLVSQRFADHHIQVGQGQLANSSVQLMMRYKVMANMISFSSFLTFQCHIWCACDQLVEKAKPKPKLALSSNFANI